MLVRLLMEEGKVVRDRCVDSSTGKADVAALADPQLVTFLPGGARQPSAAAAASHGCVRRGGSVPIRRGFAFDAAATTTTTTKRPM